MNYVGIDIGGSSIKAGVINEKGEVLKKSTIKTEVTRSAEFVCESIANQIKELTYEIEYEAVGIGCPGAIDSKNGIVVYSNNLFWKNVPLSDFLNSKINKLIKVSNDANAAALGEMKFGAGKQFSDITFITLGTGVGTGFIVGGKFFEGFKSMGAEGGHIVIKEDGIPCACGRRGCLEAYASATALIRETITAMMYDKNSEMWKVCGFDLNKVDGKTSFDAAQIGDKTAKIVVDNFIKSLSEGILNFVNLFRPQAVIIGGGVCAQGKVLTTPIQKYVDENRYGGIDSLPVKILTAFLQNDAGILGAASLVI